MGSGGYLGGYCFDVMRAYEASFAGAAVAGAGNLLVVLVIGLASLPTVRTGVIVTRRGAGAMTRGAA